MTTKNKDHDLYVLISPDSIKAVNQEVSQYDERYTNSMEGFTSFWEWFNTVWDIQHPDGTVHIVKVS
jgi:hypothetical protein